MDDKRNDFEAQSLAEPMLKTARLTVRPLSDIETRKLIENEKNEELKIAYGEMLAGSENNRGERLWYTPWTICENGNPVGDICFKGFANGEPEIGYGLYDGCCRKGYASEAVGAVTEWALSQPGVSKVVAKTEPDNIASQKLLMKLGYFPCGMELETYLFERKRK